MLVDRGHQQGFRAVQAVPHAEGGRRRADVVVVAEGHLGRDLDLPGEIDHVVVSERLHGRRRKDARLAAEVRVAAGAAGLRVGSHVGQGRMVGDTRGHARVQAGRHEAQRTALAAALDDDVPAVPLREGGQVVDHADHGQVNMLHIVGLPGFDPVAQVAGAVARLQAAARISEHLRVRARIQAVDLDHETDETALRIEAVPARDDDGVDPGARREDHDRAGTGINIFGDIQIAVDAVLVIHAHADQRAGLGRRIASGLRDLPHLQRTRLHRGDLPLPEGLEVLRQGHDRLDPFRRETELDAGLGDGFALRKADLDIAEARAAAGPDGNPRTAAAQRCRTLRVRLHQVIRHREGHGTVLRNTVFGEEHLHGSLFTDLIGPVGMVRDGEPTPVRIELRPGKETGCQQDTGSRKKFLEHHFTSNS